MILSATMSYGEIALLYFPDKKKKAATRAFSDLINRNSTLLSRLAEAGRVAGQRTFTPRMIAIITEELGEP